MRGLRKISREIPVLTPGQRAAATALKYGRNMPNAPRLTQDFAFSGMTRTQASKLAISRGNPATESADPIERVAQRYGVNLTLAAKLLREYDLEQLMASSGQLEVSKR